MTRRDGAEMIAGAGSDPRSPARPHPQRKRPRHDHRRHRQTHHAPVQRARRRRSHPARRRRRPGAAPLTRRPARRPLAISLIAVAIRALALLAIVELVGVRAVGRPLGQLDGAWVAVVAAAELSTYPAYALAYRSVTGLGAAGRVRALTVARIVVAGFGPLAAGGGFAVDRPALAALGGDATGARRTVAAMATLEWAVLAPATSAAAIALLATGARVAGSLLWPWAIGGPLLVAAMVWVGTSGRGERLTRRLPARATAVGHLLTGVDAVATLARAPRRHAGAWVGTALYWAAEIAALSAALRAAGLDLGLARTLLAYSTGYLASQRALPLGGAGLAEALLLYSLAQLHVPLGQATAAVIIYRAFNFVVTIVPALLAYRALTAV